MFYHLISKIFVFLQLARVYYVEKNDQIVYLMYKAFVLGIRYEVWIVWIVMKCQYRDRLKSGKGLESFICKNPLRRKDLYMFYGHDFIICWHTCFKIPTSNVKEAYRISVVLVLFFGIRMVLQQFNTGFIYRRILVLISTALFSFIAFILSDSLMWVMIITDTETKTYLVNHVSNWAW